jgi:hypothetical protein
MDVQHSVMLAKCPGCGARIDISVGRWPGGVNDYGGFVLQCQSCKKKLFTNIQNPDDASSVTGGATVLETWDDEMGEKAVVLAAHNLGPKDEIVGRLRFLESNEMEPPLFRTDERPIYCCLKCKKNLEEVAYECLEQALPGINRELQRFLVIYLKGYASAPDDIAVRMQVACDCTTHEMQFFKPFTEANALTAEHEDYVLAGSNDTSQLEDIDGLYARDDCVQIFKKLLARWKARNRLVLIVVPFIGLDYPSREQNRMDLWDLLLRYTNPRRTLLVTRKGTYNGFLKAASQTGLDISLLKEYDILAPLLKQLDSDDAFFKQQSHAKFYAAMGPKRTEVLSGSFNIHTGGYAENIAFRSYDNAEFLRRYVFPLDFIFDFTKADEGRRLLELEVKQDGSVTSPQ